MNLLLLFIGVRNKIRLISHVDLCNKTSFFLEFAWASKTQLYSRSILGANSSLKLLMAKQAL